MNVTSLATHLAAHLAANLTSLTPRNAFEAAHLNALIEKSNQGETIGSRSTFPVHVTASAIIVDEPQQHLLLLKHKTLGIWVQPGGHVELGENLLVAALREAEEECGLSKRGLLSFDEVPIDFDLHEIPANLKNGEPAHWHFDVRFLMHANSNALEAAADPHEMAWVNFGDSRITQDTSLIRAVNLLVTR